MATIDDEIANIEAILAEKKAQKAEDDAKTAREANAVKLDKIREANAKIAAMLAEARAKIKEAQDIADEVGVDFSVNFGGYGMGGSYFGKAMRDDPDSWAPSDAYDGWYSSSQNC